MRNDLCNSLVDRAKKNEFIFLTGDLGYMALEPLKDLLGDRFINAGISEQNMISVAASLASQNLEVWVYSIAPFIYARAFEQIRNDISFHGLSVNLIGNGGGYGYGVMGPTHHAIEDYGVLSTLQNIKIFIPAFNKDLSKVVFSAANTAGPTYLRIGKSEIENESNIPEFQSWRQLVHGHGPVIVAVGPLVGLYIHLLEKLPKEERPNLWLISEFSSENLEVPTELVNQLELNSNIIFVEEHVQQGSIGLMFLHELQSKKITLRNFKHLPALKHNFEKYGSQKYLRTKSKLDSTGLMEALENIK